MGLVLFALMGMWAGCSATKRYQVLSFFFDGVPDPNAPPPKTKTITVGGEKQVVQAAVGSVHKPFADNQCSACHKGGPESGFAVSAITAGVCLECHKDITHKYPVMHAPVASQACLWCHSPHDSPTVSLLREKSPAVCLQCHDKELLGPNPPEHQDAKRSCLDCHTGHGGQKRFFVRDVPLPTSQPAAPPTTLPVLGGLP